MAESDETVPRAAAEGTGQSALEEAMRIDLQTLSNAIGGAATFRRVRRLQPAGGQGEKIFPPAYPGARNNDPPPYL